MPLTLGLTGMDPATEAALKSAFVEANARLGNRWALVPDGEADHVVVDMDSMYGPMSWLRLHAAGRQVIGLTSAPRSQTDFRLGRPFDTTQVAALLTEVARSGGIELEATNQQPAPAPAPKADQDAAATTPAAQASEPTAPAQTAPSQTALAQSADAAQPPPAAAAPADLPTAPPPPAERSLAHWLQPGAISGRVCYRRGDAPALLIDAAADSWHGPATLKPLGACFEGIVKQADLVPVDDATWLKEAAAAGPAQPLSRLRWLGGLLAGKGELVPGMDPEARYQLNKWPQTEREYPRHFRIATQMMKGPATLAEIAEASGVPVADVTDFVNANLATGFAEPVVEAPPPAEEPAKQRGLLGRLRNR